MPHFKLWLKHGRLLNPHFLRFTLFRLPIKHGALTILRIKIHHLLLVWLRDLFKDDVPALNYLTDLPPSRDVNLNLLRDGVSPKARNDL